MHDGLLVSLYYAVLGFMLFGALGLVAELAEHLDQRFPDTALAGWAAGVGAAIVSGGFGYGLWLAAW
jgi:hypothetical protein